MSNTDKLLASNTQVYTISSSANKKNADLTRLVASSLSTQERIHILANVIVDRLMEMQRQGTLKVT